MTTEIKNLRQVIEALLFVVDRPITVEQVRETVQLEAKQIKQCFEELAQELETQERGFRLKQLAGGYQLVSATEAMGYIKQFVQNRQKKRLSQAGLETLSIVAYKQPITRTEIEHIRGVNVDGAIRTLLEKGVIRPSGRKDVPGRPILYTTTKEFLDHFGLGTIKDLPELSEFAAQDVELPDAMRPDERAKVESASASDGEAKPQEAESGIES